MRGHAENHIPQIEQTPKEEFGLVVVSYVVEAGVGGVGCVAQASGSVVLEEDVEVVEGVGFVVEEFEGVLDEKRGDGSCDWGFVGDGVDSIV